MPKAIVAPSLPLDLARRIGAISDLVGSPDEVLPQTQLDWALRWAHRGLHVFPCQSILGTPIPKKWYAVATPEVSHIVEWWSETSDADIAAVPELSGHFVFAVCGEAGEQSLAALESRHGKLAPEFETDTRWGIRHLWFKGRALTSHDYLGAGLNVIGPGRFVFLPDSLAPDNFI